MNTVFSYQNTNDVVNISELWVMIEVRRRPGSKSGEEEEKVQKLWYLSR